MASITIRNLDESIKSTLRIVAANHGHSMEEEARTILRDALHKETINTKGLAERIHQRFMSSDIDSLEVPNRDETPKITEFGA